MRSWNHGLCPRESDGSDGKLPVKKSWDDDLGMSRRFDDPAWRTVLALRIDSAPGAAILLSRAEVENTSDRLTYDCLS